MDDYQRKPIKAKLFEKDDEDGFSESEFDIMGNPVEVTPYITSYGQKVYGWFGHQYIMIDKWGEKILVDKDWFEMNHEKM